MQVLFLLGGKNSRFFPLDSISHKAMVRIYGKPLLEYTIEDFKSIGIKDIIIVIGQTGEVVKEYFGDGSNLGVNIQYALQEEPKGGGNAILCAKDLINTDFVMQNPYHIRQAEILNRMIHRFEEQNLDALIMGQKEENISEFGALVLEGKKIKGIVEKPEKGQEPSNYKITSTYFFRNEFLEYLEKEEEHEYSFEDAIETFAKSKEVEMFEDETKESTPLKYAWHLFGIRELLSQSQEGYRASGSFVAENAIVEDSVIIDEGAKVFEGACVKGNTYIGKNAVIGNNAVVRDSDIGAGVSIGVNSDITRSIIMEGTSSHGAGFIGDSVIGPKNKIAAGFITANKRTDRLNIKTKIKDQKIDTGINALGVVTGTEVKFGINSSTMPGSLIGEGSQVWPGAIVHENLDVFTELKLTQTQEKKSLIKKA
ncbi:MAG TPA: sugar phosphate nucleotidyltransferase [Candidatus Dojkabacteria bacterium]|jgi:bifunctional UDP-N-acetylglucosamine pyrophosphorylase/glucosamine-1-phosphate N-acetyltransferase